MMIDTDLFVEWIEVPDDLPVLTPVDEEVPIYGLNDIATSLTQSQADFFDDQTYETNSGLLLGCQPVDGVDMTLIPHSGTNAFLSTFGSSPSHVSYSNMCPPALSPDSSPSSVASTTPWLRTPILENMGNLTSADVLWNMMDRETSSTINLVDQSGNSLEDISSQAHIMPENIACSPESRLDTCLPHNTPSFTISPSYFVSTPQAEVVQLGPLNCLSLATSSQSSFLFSPVTSASPSLSPLSTLSFFSPSPGASTNPLPLINYSTISPAFLPMSLSDSDSDQLELEGMDSIRLRGKRSFGTLGDDQVPKRSNAKNDDDDEWDPESERVKRTRVVAHPTIPNSLQDGSTREESQDATHTCCEFCGQRFTRPSDYIRHIENSANHPETRKVWPCPYCDSPLGRKDALGRHIRTIHPGKPVFIPEGILGSRLPGSQKDPSVQRMGLRKNSSKRQLRKDTRRSR